HLPRTQPHTKYARTHASRALCNAAVSARGSGQLVFGLTHVDTRCMVNDDDLQEISIFEAVSKHWKTLFMETGAAGR
ncbi:MAG: hypothetical protein ACK55Z_32340, partial [bacterium]